MISAKRYTCCHMVTLFGRQEDLRTLGFGPRLTTLDVQLVDGDCYRCQLSKDLGHKPGQIEDDPINDECLAGRHEFKLDADRLRGSDKYPGQIYGTGGWDLSFHCIRQPCRAAKYTTYGLTPIYLSDAVGTMTYEWDRSPAEFDY